MISLIIKGNRRQARRAADVHGVAITIVREVKRDGKLTGETVAMTVNEFSPQVIQWFGEQSATEAPYPIGALLLYSHLNN